MSRTGPPPKPYAGTSAEAPSALPALLRWVRTLFAPATSITLTLGDPRSPAQTLTHDTRGQALDGAQWQADQGPALSAHATGALITSADLVTDRRWPHLQLALAAEAPTSALAVPLCQGQEVVGVLCAYSDPADDSPGDPTGALTGKDVLTRASWAAAAAALVVAVGERAERAEAEAAQLRQAMATRAVIEQAKGILAVHLGVGAEDAFAVLSRVSQHHNVKVTPIAQMLVGSPRDPEMIAVLHQTAQRHGLLPPAGPFPGPQHP